MSRKTPLKSSGGLARSATLKAAQGEAGPKEPAKPRKPMARQSERQKARQAAYTSKRKEFLAKHPFCERCAKSGKRVYAQEVHHRRGRGVMGGVDLTTDETEFCGLCSACHRWVHDHPAQAMADGYMKSRHSNGL